MALVEVGLRRVESLVQALGVENMAAGSYQSLECFVAANTFTL